MQSVPRTILKEFEKKSGLKLGKAVRGTYGLIYNLKDYPNRVVKIVGDWCAAITLETIKTLKSLKGIPVVKVFQYGALSDNYYYYVMERLRKIKGNSDWVYEMENWGSGSGDYVYYDCKLSEAPPKVKTFFKAARTTYSKHGLRYDDLHGGNIMQNSRGVLKFIDLESF